MRHPFENIRALWPWAMAVCLVAAPARAQEVVQVDVKSLLNARSVTTFTDGKIVPWVMGIDGDGTADGYMTEAAAAALHDPRAKALPNDGVFPAHGGLPTVVLNYSNADGKSPQTHYLIGTGRFKFPVPPAHYSRLFLFLTLGEGAYKLEGPPNLRVTLHYTDGTASHDYQLLDYAAQYPPDHPDFLALISDRDKWHNDETVAERGNHNIHALDVHPDAGKILRSVKVEKTRKETRYPKRAGYLVFWGATGVTSTPAH